MTNPSEHIAYNVKYFRSDRGWSLDRLSKEAGVSKAMLGQIERGESSPTITTLWKIVAGLNVPLSSLLEALPDKDICGVTSIRDANDLRRKIANDEMLVSPLFPYDPTVGFEYFELTFPAGYERLSAPHKTGVVEIKTVIEGALEVLSDEKWHLVKKGQSIRIRGDQSHGYRNKTDQKAVAITTICYPGSR